MSARLYSIFISNVRDRMAELNLTQAALADRLKVTPSHISQLLSGHRRPGLEGLEDMGKALDMEPSDLLRKRILSRTG